MLVKNTDDAPVDLDAGWETSAAKQGGARSLLWWTWRDLSLAVRRRGETNMYDQLFALRCWCGKWFGCSEHWFCGTCDDCNGDGYGCSCTDAHTCEAHRA